MSGNRSIKSISLGPLLFDLAACFGLGMMLYAHLSIGITFVVNLLQKFDKCKYRTLY